VRGVKSQLVICHNRKASSAQRTSELSSHPFKRQFGESEVAFCHNGTVTSMVEEAKRHGRVDTELFFEAILAGQNELTLESVAWRVSELARSQKFTSLTGLLLTPGVLFAWRLFSDERLSNYYTLSRHETEGRVIIASEPIDTSSGWALIPNGTMCCVSVEGGKIRTRERKLDCPGLPA